jgi:hypothetical protein
MGLCWRSQQGLSGDHEPAIRADFRACELLAHWQTPFRSLERVSAEPMDGSVLREPMDHRSRFDLLRRCFEPILLAIFAGAEQKDE